MDKDIKKKQGIQSEEILEFCGVVLCLIAIITFLALWGGLKYNFFVALASGFGVFTTGIFLYVIAKICRTLIEILKTK